jgi:hypothetical protein
LKLKQNHNKLFNDNKILETENSRLKLENEKFKGKNEELVNMTKLFFDLELKLKKTIKEEEKDSEEEEKKTRLREHLTCLSISTKEEEIKTEEEFEVLSKENSLLDENLIEDVSPPKNKKIQRTFKL